jgi:hypothetical protein
MPGPKRNRDDRSRRRPRGLPAPLLDLVEIAMVRDQRLVGLLSRPVVHEPVRSTISRFCMCGGNPVARDHVALSPARASDVADLDALGEGLYCGIE